MTIKVDNIPMPRAFKVRKPATEWETLPDYQRGYECGRYTKVIRDPGTVSQWAKTFVVRNEFDRGFLIGLTDNMVSIVEIEQMHSEAKTYDVTKNSLFAPVTHYGGERIREWQKANPINGGWRGK